MLSFVKLYVLRQRYDVSCCFSSRMLISYFTCLDTGDCKLPEAVLACAVVQELSLRGRVGEIAKSGNAFPKKVEQLFLTS